MMLKQYRVRLRAGNGAPVQLWAESAQEACEKAGWLIGDCYVQELRADEVDLSKKVRYAKEVYGELGILGVRCWNAGECFIAIVAIQGGVNDWAAYVGALPNQRIVNQRTKEDLTSAQVLAGAASVADSGSAEFEIVSTTEEEVVRYTCSHGGKMGAEEAAAMFGLPVKQYRR